MDYRSIQAKTTRQLISYGVLIRLNRDGNDVAKCFGVFTNSDANDLDARKFTPVSGTASAQTNVLVPGALKIKPAIGDLIITKQGTFTVLEMTVVQPGDIPILYKLRVK